MVVENLATLLFGSFDARGLFGSFVARGLVVRGSVAGRLFGAFVIVMLLVVLRDSFAMRGRLVRLAESVR